ncbi:HesA/MoeB/ThiF family protein [Amaricoccus solimangrovi]|uniref:Molybdopterin-synthase adenylyltransferase n=1 Tax=Amaricoccus solimangrovi TaxID=2589815 RepID=A0A501WR47_9RHOB|nr:HesA/MoeB/ThiF family protein [Amaricoccus solimangrovi]TPE50815.1 HesA/MoeB/ThiF family protein [Amaricoccus solimangrovi]
MSGTLAVLALLLALSALGCARLVGAGRPVFAGILVWGLVLVGLSQTLPGADPARLAFRLGWAGAIAAPVLGYALLIRALRRRARGTPPPEAARTGGSGMTPDELTRYARHIVLREIGGPGQARLRAARVAVVGAGGLGDPALLYLAAAGAGALTVIDDDAVALSNLQRQILFGTPDIGAPKAEAARAALTRLNPDVAVEARTVRLDAENAPALLAGATLVIDGSDNFATRYAVNAACVALGIPLLSAAMSQWEGQVALFDPARGGPCYRCLFPEPPAEGLAPSCAEAGVIGPLPGVLGALLALEAVKHLAGAGRGLRGRLLLFDGLRAETRQLRVSARADCPDCGGRGA